MGSERRDKREAHSILSLQEWRSAHGREADVSSKDAKKQVRQGALELLGLLLGDASFAIPASPKGLGLALLALGVSATTGSRFNAPRVALYITFCVSPEVSG